MELALTRMRLAGGIWEGLLEAPGAKCPKLRLRHLDDVIGEPEIAEAGEGTRGGWIVRFNIPVERISEGVHTFVVEDASSGRALARETVIAGETAEDDLRAEVSQLRAELDLLKRAFRRHCAEG